MVIFQKCEHLPEPECACVRQRICALNDTAQNISVFLHFIPLSCPIAIAVSSLLAECTLFDVFRDPNGRCTMPIVPIEDDTFQL